VRVPTAALLVLAMAGCAPEQPLPGPDVVARVAGRELRHGDFERHVQRNLGGDGEALTSEALSGLLDQFLDEQLLLQLAIDRGLVSEIASPGRAVDALLAGEAVADPAPQEVEAWFRAHAAELARPERVEMIQYLFADREVAERTRRELVAGADPEEAAEAVAGEPGGGGGQRGVFGRDDLPPAFAAVIFDLPEGGVSEVVEADYGFHLFLVERRLPANAPTLEEATPEIAERLRSEAADRTLSRLVAEAGSRYAVEVFDRNLPFAYRGSHPVSRPYENR